LVGRGHGTILADAGEGITDKHVDKACATVRGCGEDAAGRLVTNFADNRRIAAARDGPQGSERGIRLIRCNYREELAFIRDVKRVEAKKLAGTADGVTHRNLLLEKRNGATAIACKFVERRSYSAARRIAHPANAWAGRADDSFDQRENGPGIGLNFGLKLQFTAGEEYRDAMIADGAGEKDLVAGAHGVG
jgi:hypothetical protein